MAAGGHRDLRPLAPAADQHADPALLGLRRHLGAPRAGARRTTAQHMKWGLWLAIGLGVLFTIFQAYEYSHAAFGFAGNIYGANFFMATGFHGFHVIIGTIFLAVCLLRRLSRPLHPGQARRLRGGGLVLALRRRGVAVPVRRRLHLGLADRSRRVVARDRPPRARRDAAADRAAPARPRRGRGPARRSGVWQLQRLEWKTAILDRIEARLAAAPVAVPPRPRARARPIPPGARRRARSSRASCTSTPPPPGAASATG